MNSHIGEKRKWSASEGTLLLLTLRCPEAIVVRNAGTLRGTICDQNEGIVVAFGESRSAE